MEAIQAPDAFYTALVMKKQNMYYSRGDFAEMLRFLETDTTLEIKDVANKLALIR